MWMNAPLRPTTANSPARTWLAPSCASVQKDSSRSEWRTTAATSTNARPTTICVRTVTASTPKDHISANVTKDSNPVLMASSVSVISTFPLIYLWHFPIIYIETRSFTLDTDWTDRRTGYCFRQLMNGRCTTRTDGLMQVTKADCCCTMGAAWGLMCEHCPTKGSEAYEELCLEVGYSVDGNGCRPIHPLSFTSRLTVSFFH